MLIRLSNRMRSRLSFKSYIIIISIILFIMFIVIQITGTHNDKVYTVKCTATITNKESWRETVYRKRHRSYVTYYSFDLEYEYNGIKYKVHEDKTKLNMSSKNSLEIYINPDNPEKYVDFTETKSYKMGVFLKTLGVISSPIIFIITNMVIRKVKRSIRQRINQ